MKTKTKTNLNEINIIDMNQFGFTAQQMEAYNLYGTGTDNYGKDNEPLEVPETTEAIENDYDWGSLFE